MSDDYVSFWVEAGAEVHHSPSCSCNEDGAGPALPAGKRKGPEALLGKHGKSVNPPSSENRFGASSQEIPPRVARYFFQSIARHLLPNTGLDGCLRRRQGGVSAVEVRKGKEKAYYGGLQTCHSVWGCPVCAAKISERRRVQLEEAIKIWEEGGGIVLLATYTVRHHRKQSLIEVLEGALKARKLMMNRKGFKSVCGKIQQVGSIRALEVTWGEENGWHAHFHELLFLSPPAADSPLWKKGQEWFATFACPAIQRAILPLWQKACVDVGLDKPNGHGVSIQNGYNAGAYASKWGRALEMTKGHVKKGREGRYTPWDFLRNFEPGKEDKWGKLFQEYFWAFKGKRQLVWSEGLFKLIFGKDKQEETDAAIAAEVDQADLLLGWIEFADWQIVLATEKRGELLEVAYKGGWEAAQAFIENLWKNTCPS